MSVTTYQAIAMIIYLVAMIMIGLFAYNRTSDFDDYMLGGRKLGACSSSAGIGYVRLALDGSARRHLRNRPHRRLDRCRTYD